jgi:hypothetical protein
MGFVPEGQHDSSQARSAWNHEENNLVPAGRLNRSQLRSDASKKLSRRPLARTFQQEYLAFLKRLSSVSTTNIVGLTMTSTVHSGTGASLHRYPGTSCLATISLSLRHKSHSPVEAPHNYLNAMGFQPWEHPRKRFALKGRELTWAKCALNATTFGSLPRR